MKYVDVLVSVAHDDGDGAPFYDVQLLNLPDGADEHAAARRRIRVLNAKYAKSGVVRRLIGVAPSGTYDSFIGKYVGQFIDEAFLDVK
jgi:hypothetical protein